MSDETIKDKTRRLERIVKGKNAGKTDVFVFSDVRKMIELALAEHREVCARICDKEVYPLLVSESEVFMAGVAQGAKACAHRIRYSANEPCKSSTIEIRKKVIEYE